MITRQLGDLQVGAIGLGCMGMAMVYGRPDPTEARATIDQALDGGVTLLDTADMYGNGASERFVGNAIRGRRERVVLATKTGDHHPTVHRHAERSRRPAGSHPPGSGGNRCVGSAPTTSISTICTGSIRGFRSRRVWGRSRTW